MEGKFSSVDLKGVRVASIQRADLETYLLRELERAVGGWVVTANLDILRQCDKDRAAAALVAEANIVVGDGMPLVWASRLAGTPLPERIAGADLMWTLTERAAENGRSVYLLGGRNGSAERVGQLMQERYPGLRMAGWDCPVIGFDRSEAMVSDVLERLKSADPDIVYVGLGFPKQDRLIRRIREVSPRCWCIGVGVSIDFGAGRVRRAPKWAQDVGAEWLFRFSQEPGKLGKRYFVDGVPYAVLLLTWAAWQRFATRKGRQ